MAIPKKYKKKIKSSYQSESPKPKMTWSFDVGDLVEFKGSCHIVIEKRKDGYFKVTGPDGILWAKGKDMFTIQRNKVKN
jgi:hypothetical protein